VFEKAAINFTLCCWVT